MLTRTRSRSARPAAAVLAALLAACGGSSSSKKSTPVTLAAVELVAPDPAFLVVGRRMRLGAVARYSDGTRRIVTTEAVFTTSNAGAVQVADRTAGGTGGRLIAALGAIAGDWADVTATWSGTTSAPVRVRVADPVAVGPGIDDDPLLPQQWHLLSTPAPSNGVRQSGFSATATGDASGGAWDIHAAGYAYAHGYTGRGVKVAVIDSGLETNHEDFWTWSGATRGTSNVTAGSWDFTQGDANPTTTRTAGDHGTSVAGLIAAVNDNARGGMGVAPRASLNGYNLLDRNENQTLGNYLASLGAGTGAGGPRANDVWIFNQSYGVSDVAPIPPDASLESAYWDGANNLRGGLGAVYVKSAGNSFETPDDPNSFCTPEVTCENASMDPTNTLPPNIVVGALNAAGVRSSYSTAGSAIWVAGFGGESGGSVGRCPFAGCAATFFEPAMVTVDQSGCGAGYSPRGPYPSPISDFNASGPSGYFDQYLNATVNATCNYTNTFNGTSSAAPVVSGVVALILEANPSLTWRDVKYVLAATAAPVDTQVPPVRVGLSDAVWDAEPAWTANAVGLPFHNWYGFGLVDADAAVAYAEAWSPGALGTLQSTGWRAGAIGRGPITPDSYAGAGLGTAAIPAGIAFVEAVQVQVRTDHPYLGYLGVELTSPSGTRSVLLNPFNAFQLNEAGTVLVQLASNMFYGEPSAGTWTLRVVNASNGGTGSLRGWSIRIYGH